MSERWLARDGSRIYCTEVAPQGCEKGRVVIVHGLGEHSGSHHALVGSLADHGYRVVTFDLRGTGRSTGLRGHVHRFEDFASDTRAVLQSSSYDGRTFVLGHSMGGLIAVDFALTYPDQLDGLVLSSPCLGIAMQIPTWKIALARSLANLIPTLSQSHGISSRLLTHDEAVRAEYRADPLRSERVTLRLYTEMVRKMTEVGPQAGRLALPVLLIQGGADQVVSPREAKRFYDGIATTCKEVIWYDSALHEVFKDERVDASRRLVEWLDRQTVVQA